MYFSELLGQALLSFGAPTEWMVATQSAPPRMRVKTSVSTRVIRCMLTTTYAESVISTPYRASGESIGPIENGMTYMVWPRIEPAKCGARSSFMAAGAIQLLVGPASA